MASTVTYEFYQDTYGGGLSEADETSERFMRAVCAALEAFAEYGAGEVGGYTIGEFSVKNYASQQTTGEELATAAALRELGLSGMAFTGVC